MWVSSLVTFENLCLSDVEDPDLRSLFRNTDAFFFLASFNLSVQGTERDKPHHVAVRVNISKD